MENVELKLVPKAGGDWGDEDATRVQPMVGFDDGERDVVSSADIVAGSIDADADADTMFDDRSIDDLVALALGTGDTHLEAATSDLATVPAAAHPAFTPHGVAGTSPFAQQAPPPHPGYPQPMHGVQVAHAPMIPYPDPAQMTADQARMMGYAFPAQMMQPAPAAPRSQALRSGAIVLALLLTAALGIAAGMLLFAGGSASEPARAAASRTAAPAAVPAATAVTQPVAPPTSPAPPAPVEPTPAVANAPIAVAVTSLAHPTAGTLAAPSGGMVARSMLGEARQVRAGEKLFEIKRAARPSVKADALAARVKELEKLSESDPVYKPFLERARRDAAHAQPGSETIAVKAPAAGLMEPGVKKGDRVDDGQTMATLVDGQVWIAKAVLTGDERPGVHWACTIESGDQGKRAPCSIEQIEEDKSGVAITVKAEARAAGWLRDGRQDARLLFEPPADAH